MKKAAMGLVGIVLSIIGGCTVYKANEEVNQILAHRAAAQKIFNTNPEDVNQMMVHYNAIKKIVGAKPEDDIYLSAPEKKGELLIVNILGKIYTKIVKYTDINGDGKYEERSSSSVELRDPTIKILPPPTPGEQKKQENLQKKIDKSKLWAYDL